MSLKPKKRSHQRVLLGSACLLIANSGILAAREDRNLFKCAAAAFIAPNWRSDAGDDE